MRTGIGIAIVVAIGLIWSVAVIAPRFPNPIPPPASPRGARPNRHFCDDHHSEIVAPERRCDLDLARIHPCLVTFRKNWRMRYLALF